MNGSYSRSFSSSSEATTALTPRFAVLGGLSEQFYVENPTIFQDRARVVEKSGSKLCTTPFSGFVTKLVLLDWLHTYNRSTALPARYMGARLTIYQVYTNTSTSTSILTY